LTSRLDMLYSAVPTRDVSYTDHPGADCLDSRRDKEFFLKPERCGPRLVTVTDFSFLEVPAETTAGDRGPHKRKWGALGTSQGALVAGVSGIV